VVGADVVPGQVEWHLTGVLDPGRVAALQAELDGREVPAGSAAAIGVLLSPDAPDRVQVVEVADALARAVLDCRRALEVESTLSSLLGATIVAAPDDSDPAEWIQAQLLLLTVTIELAAAAGGPQGLAVLRALQAVGPRSARERAGRHAGCLAARGLPEPPWATGIGRPRFVRAWEYKDVFGQQTSVGLLFDYAGREHAILTLVDHSLGGGVKDAFLVEGRRASRLRDDTWEQLADEPAAVIQDVVAGRAAQVLIEALLEDACPEHQEQVQTLADTDALLRSRTVFLAELAGLTVPAEVLEGPAADDASAGDGAGILRLKVQLVDVRPPVWRRLEVPAALTLAELHDVLQRVFGWDDAHLHAFERPAPKDERGRGGRPRRERVSDGRERRLRVGALLAQQDDVLHYRYDFGDDWDHRIVLEERLDPVDGLAYPRCTGGRRATPPEDCGGAPGYQNLLAALADPTHPEHDGLLTWVPEGFDPAAFSAAEADAALAWAREDRA
jgi:hypothetical protein